MYSGGGAYCGNGTRATLRQCEVVDSGVSGEMAPCGGGLYINGGAEVVLEECVLARNRAGAGLGGFGGTIYVRESSATLRGCTLVRNTADNQGAAIHADYDAMVSIENAIVAFNQAYLEEQISIYCNTPGQVMLSCCDVYGNEQIPWEGRPGQYDGCIEGQEGVRGNISADPLFCDLEGGDYRLSDSSPCLPFTPPNPECDLIGARGLGCGPSAVDPPGPRASQEPMLRCHPSPAITSAGLLYRLPVAGAADPSVRTLDSAGRVVRRIPLLARPGDVQATAWDLRDDAGAAVAAGVYNVQLKAAGRILTTGRVMVIR